MVTLLLNAFVMQIKIMKLRKYRIVRDNFCGYECQVWRLWFPFWVQMNLVNTHISLASAINYIEKCGKKVVWESK